MMNKNVIPNLFRNLDNFNDNVNSLSAFVSVWIILKGEEVPRLITLMPGGKKDEI